MSVGPALDSVPTSQAWTRARYCVGDVAGERRAVRSERTPNALSEGSGCEKGARCTARALALSAVIVGLLVPLAFAKKTAYSGPLLGPPTQKPGSSVAFKVESKGKGKTLRPVAVRKFFFYFLIVSCHDSEGPTELSSTAASGSPRLPLKKGAFADSLSDGGITYEIQGRVPRKGPATGTIRLPGATRCLTPVPLFATPR